MDLRLRQKVPVEVAPNAHRYNYTCNNVVLVGGLGCRGMEKKWVIVLRDIRVGGVFIFIRFYGLEKHCHAYQLALEQMAQCGCMYHMHKCAHGVRSRSLTVTSEATSSGQSTGEKGSG